MKHTLRNVLIALAIGVCAVALGGHVAHAAISSPQGVNACAGVADAGGTCDVTGSSLSGAFKTIATTLIFLVGAISVIMIIIGGLRYVLANGDSAGLKSAKDTILYSLIGVVVAILAYALVAFILSRFG